uniref:Uncharacterized protein n=1 Tax=Clastoptera arizonana TaxID=38151 RepID=A0A1B6D3H9_9HEMI
MESNPKNIKNQDNNNVQLYKAENIKFKEVTVKDFPRLLKDTNQRIHKNLDELKRIQEKLQTISLKSDTDFLDKLQHQKYSTMLKNENNHKTNLQKFDLVINHNLIMNENNNIKKAHSVIQEIIQDICKKQQ